jgi:alkyl sulfatase BDS1-like metallo-beta-lactamase superfamily hydrolase
VRAAKNSSFTDKSDFEEAKRLYRSGAVQQNHDDKGGVAWDIDNWSFLLNGKEYDSINPSLQRQATLNMEYGLFEVVPGIYPPPGGSAPTVFPKRGRGRGFFLF